MYAATEEYFDIGEKLGDEFFDMEFEVRANVLRLSVNGKQVRQLRNSDVASAGAVGVSSSKGKAQFKDIEVMILDPETNSVESPAAKPETGKAPVSTKKAAVVPAKPVQVPAVSTKQQSQPSAPTPKPGTRTRTLAAGYCMDVAVTPDMTQCVSIDLEGDVTLWEQCTGKNLGTLGKHGGRADELLLIADGRIACSGSYADGTTAFFDLKRRGESLGKITGQPGLVRLAVTADGQRLLLNSGTSVRIYCITLASRKAPLSSKQQQMIAGKKLAFRAETSEGTFQLHEDVSLPSYLSIASHPVNADWIYLETINGTTSFRLWDLRRQKDVAHFEGLDAWPQTIRVSGDGKRVTAKSGKAKHLVWDAATGKVVTQFDGPAFLAAIDISHDGSRVMTHGSEAHLEEWSVDPPKKLWELRTQRTRTHHVHYFDKGRQVILAGAYGAEIWKLDTP